MQWNYLMVCCLCLPEVWSWETDTEEGKFHNAQTLFEINAQPDNLIQDGEQRDEMLRDTEREKHGKTKDDYLHLYRRPKRSFNPVNKYPLDANLKISEQSFDLDYRTDDMSSHTGFNGRRPQEDDHSRIGRDVNESKGEEEVLEYPYDYESFHREYFDYMWEKKNESMMEPSRFYTKLAKMSQIQDFIVCYPDDWQTGVGAIALYCTLYRGSTKGFTKAEFSRLGQVLKFWAIVYLVAGGALWVICGWCCCCLRCTACNPDKIREEVRSYVIYNPPGVMRDTATGDTIEYTPTQEEKEAHKELQIKAFAFV